MPACDSLGHNKVQYYTACNSQANVTQRTRANRDNYRRYLIGCKYQNSNSDIRPFARFDPR